MFVGAVVLFVTYSALPVAVHARVAGDTTVPVLAGRQAGVGSTQGGSAPASGRVLLRSDRFTPVVVAGLGAGALDVPVDTPVVADTPVARPRPRAIEYSDAYNTRLTIHRVGSYLILPMFGAEYWLGQKLISQTTPAASWVKPTHRAVALGVATVFSVNTVTGVWNLWDSRQDPNDRTRRLVHTLSMLAADGGFVATGLTAHHAAFSYNREVTHRDIALASIGVSTASALYMWLTK